MKKTIISLMTPFILILILVSSCTIEKRHYMPGYHVNRVGQKSNDKNIQQEKATTFKNFTNTINNSTEELNEPVLLASEKETEVIIGTVEKETTPLFTINKKQENLKQQDNDCDEIILRNGNDISVKVTEVGTTEVKYRMCDNLSGPLFTKNKSEIFMIKYANGTSTVFNEEPANNNIVSQTNNYITPPSANSNDRNYLVAILLWVFLGAIGIHRFYLGYVGMGVLYLLTGGLCGIGWIIDGIMLLTGSLKPKYGNYIK
ncbi:MAG: TM2 domain-containing protein [Bacteroidales bacterium]|nr:TM2 domain-containing protein [Bacteroidales bacterium]